MAVTIVGLRKLTALCVATVASSLLAYFGRIDSGTYEVVMVAALAGFFTANAYVGTNKLTKEGTKNAVQQ